MSWSKNHIPRDRKHKRSKQAIVTLNGKDFYLGLYGSKASKAEYDRLITEWLAVGRRLSPGLGDDITIVELCHAYWQFAKTYYRKNGKPTGQLPMVKVALRLLRESYGRTRVSEFGPLSLKAIQTKLIEQGCSRNYINDHTGRIKRVFKWGATNELIPVEVFQRVQLVPGLSKGRTAARETDPITPVDDEAIDRTLPHLPDVVADMVQIQRLTGCRPAEVCNLRPRDLDISGKVWEYRLDSHKTEHLGRERIVFIGPKAQAILRPYLLRHNSDYCFSPAESEKKRRLLLHEHRTTPMKCGNRPGTNRKMSPKRSPCDRYTTASYRRAIHRACDKSFTPPADLSQTENKAWRKEHRWSPNQLRHTAATDIRKRYGLEASQTVLGHASADVTQIYAERDYAKAREIMREVG